jgi:transcription initiation factor TFIIIB Brf1 subunit/transcription initiation factor TFIIB
MSICPTCNVPMGVNGSEFICPSCSLQCANMLGNKDDYSECMRGSSHFKSNIPYDKTQRKIILTQIKQNFKIGLELPDDIAERVATRYNNIQKTCADGSSKFVRRGHIKNGILAALIYNECIRSHCARKKRDIALLMKLPCDGFSRGETILRSLMSQGSIPNDTICEETADCYLPVYMERLKILDKKASAFVLEIVNRAEHLNIASSSLLESKVVGAIWLYIKFTNLGITPGELETKTNNTKKSTFSKFSKAVEGKMHLFQDIFDTYGIPTTK